MKFLHIFDTITLGDNTQIIPVKVTTTNNKIAWGFVDLNNKLVTVGGKKLTTTNDLIYRVIYQNRLILFKGNQ